eukprot:TRINITY_DN1974_c0_g1_i1.p1 TRINITY_DN1974_c0_g1~~TRINITY_DN1974_c0_g1_i1.p1  ORF type:complete len:490 (-),score=84.07 TRINITY_DN1974_c0_g1_i1:122-1540(-)
MTSTPNDPTPARPLPECLPSFLNLMKRDHEEHDLEFFPPLPSILGRLGFKAWWIPLSTHLPLGLSAAFLSNATNEQLELFFDDYPKGLTVFNAPLCPNRRGGSIATGELETTPSWTNDWIGDVGKADLIRSWFRSSSELSSTAETVRSCLPAIADGCSTALFHGLLMIGYGAEIELANRKFGWSNDTYDNDHTKDKVDEVVARIVEDGVYSMTARHYGAGPVERQQCEADDSVQRSYSVNEITDIYVNARQSNGWEEAFVDAKAKNWFFRTLMFDRIKGLMVSEKWLTFAKESIDLDPKRVTGRELGILRVIAHFLLDLYTETHCFVVLHCTSATRAIQAIFLAGWVNQEDRTYVVRCLWRNIVAVLLLRGREGEQTPTARSQGQNQKFDEMWKGGGEVTEWSELQRMACATGVAHSIKMVWSCYALTNSNLSTGAASDGGGSDSGDDGDERERMTKTAMLAAEIAIMRDIF